MAEEEKRDWVESLRFWGSCLTAIAQMLFGIVGLIIGISLIWWSFTH